MYRSELPLLHRHAAGIDLGSFSHWKSEQRNRGHDDRRGVAIMVRAEACTLWNESWMSLHEGLTQGEMFLAELNRWGWSAEPLPFGVSIRCPVSFFV